jgi:hypothetical protein
MKEWARGSCAVLAAVTLASCYKSDRGDGGQDASSDPLFDSSQDAAPDNDNGADEDAVPPDGEDVSVDRPGEDTSVDTLEEETAPACIPSLSHLRPILSQTIESVDSGEHERPEVITLPDNSFYILGRKITTDVPPEKLTAIKVATSGSRGGDPVNIFGAADLPPFHDFLPVQDGMLTIFKDLAGLASGKIMFVGYIPSPPTPSSPLPLESTTANSDEAYAVDNHTNLYVVWTETEAGVSTTIKGGFVEYNVTGGVPIDLAGAAPPAAVGQPVVAYDGTGYLIAYFYHGGPDDPAGVDSLRLIELSADGVPGPEEETIDLELPVNSIVGRPSIVWAGDRYAVLWQEAGGGDYTPSSMHLTTKMPGEAALDLDITERWIPPISSFPYTQPGELDMVWTGRSLGLLISHDGMTAGKKIYFIELRSNGDRLSEPLLVNTGASSSFNPSITYMETAADSYFLFAWLQFSIGGICQVYTATYGCTTRP